MSVWCHISVIDFRTTATNFLNSYLDELREAKIPSFWIGATGTY